MRRAATCHAAIAAQAAAHTHHKNATCLDCHMPKVLTGVLDKFADHSIDVPNIRNTIAHGVPNACGVCHRDKSAGALAASLDSWWPERARAQRAAHSPGRCDRRKDRGRQPAGALRGRARFRGSADVARRGSGDPRAALSAPPRRMSSPRCSTIPTNSSAPVSSKPSATRTRADPPTPSHRSSTIRRSASARMRRSSWRRSAIRARPPRWRS